MKRVSFQSCEHYGYSLAECLTRSLLPIGVILAGKVQCIIFYIKSEKIIRYYTIHFDIYLCSLVSVGISFMSSDSVTFIPINIFTDVR